MSKYRKRFYFFCVKTCTYVNYFVPLHTEILKQALNNIIINYKIISYYDSHNFQSTS
jgi:hypothetical protein